MKTSLLFIFLFLSIHYVASQNLVQNPDFESLSSEPCGIINTSIEFTNAMDNWQVANAATPDIFLTSIDQNCWNYQPNSTYPGPIGIKGSQDPHSGSSFVGLFAYTIDGLNQRDYIQVELSEAMEMGSEYIVEFYVSLADSTEYAINSFGAHLSSTAISGTDDGPLDYIPHVQFDGFVSDTQNWVRIADTIVAEDNYEFISIGNFNDDANTSTQDNPNSAGCVGCYGSYYFIDDVSITLLEPTGINEFSNKLELIIYPIPFDHYFLINANVEIQDAKIKIYDLNGRLFKTIENSTFKSIKIDSKSLANGYYLIEITHQYGVEKHKILKSN